ncbi:unknown protein [Seminavis robusta]|uniref:Uncharacterized protein n=1 Tax=Seminavis robusta TaxID=568900 RepID=A0A9N8I1M8_9STRA|nr:unknown protein [Seminavis robusta]|eukprot:Sro3939_g352000.1 n/a (164) ;mRNA; f:965-1456
MIKNYQYMQDTYRADHRYVHRMRTVVHRLELAVDLVEASTKLHHWSKKIEDDIAAAESDNGEVVRASISDKLHELGNNVTDLLRTRQQEQLNQTLILQGIGELKQGQSDIKSSVDSLTEAIRQLTTQLEREPTVRAPAATPAAAPSPPRQPQQQSPTRQQSPI